MRVSVMRIRFNPHPYVGCDLTPIFCSFAPMVFQSTHPRRVRLMVLMLRTVFLSFNPRTHVGCDRIFSKCLNIILQKYIICE